MQRRHLLNRVTLAALALTSLSGLAGLASAQNYPNKVI